jgi:hypothetical protein
MSKLIKLGWTLLACIGLISGKPHPLYISVVEIEQNQKEQSLEISCRIFTNDFETTLKKQHSDKIDLLNPLMKEKMNPLVRDYVLQHLQIQVNGKSASMEYIGYEQADESVAIYFQVNKINAASKISVKDNILYEYKTEQMSMIHVTVNHTRKSTKLNNPDNHAEFVF